MYFGRSAVVLLWFVTWSEHRVMAAAAAVEKEAKAK